MAGQRRQITLNLCKWGIREKSRQDGGEKCQDIMSCRCVKGLGTEGGGYYKVGGNSVNFDMLFVSYNRFQRILYFFSCFEGLLGAGWRHGSYQRPFLSVGH